MLIRRPDEIPSSEITPPSLYVSRRRFIREAAGYAALAAVSPGALAACDRAEAEVRPGAVSQEAELTPFEDVTGYNNFYEFGLGKDDPERNAGKLKTSPWTVTIEGHCERPGQYDLEDILGRFPLEDRTYRLRCVEAWSM
ncbi:MAG: mononuclear molybdenum enzyme YedY, partial [Gemmatimonadetes bacterium]|nr:mononuclear molybdenum enzyme YedY [Gemmatimonadota bacterium]